MTRPWILLALALAACATPMTKASNAELRKQVADAEQAFAQTMADRDLAAFTSFLSQETVFFSGPKPLRGPAEVTAFWKRFYETPKPPFSWRPETVEVLESGTLALSTGPVFDPSGKKFATFTSLWRQEAPGVWRIVFDKGNPECDCENKP
jgi:ketosteroid isomerase-like protein